MANDRVDIARHDERIKVVEKRLDDHHERIEDVEKWKVQELAKKDAQKAVAKFYLAVGIGAAALAFSIACIIVSPSDALKILTELGKLVHSLH